MSKAEAAPHEHPDEVQYIKVAIFLAVVTAAEVAVFYLPALSGMARWILSVMMLVKFSLVAMWFMHLRFDSPIFRRFFVLGIVLSLLVFAVVLWTFTKAVRDPGPEGGTSTTSSASAPAALLAAGE